MRKIEIRGNGWRKTRYVVGCPSCGRDVVRMKCDVSALCLDCVKPVLAKISRKSWYKNGSENPNWSGGISRHTSGYVLIHSPRHHRATKSGYVMEHILVAENKISRPLHSDEVVHHINGIKNDNRPENLEVMTRSDHSHHHNGFAKLYPCKKCGKMSKFKAFCSRAHSCKIDWPTREWVLEELKTKTLSSIASRLGVSRQAISYRFNIWPRKSPL